MLEEAAAPFMTRFESLAKATEEESPFVKSLAVVVFRASVSSVFPDLGV